MTPATDPRKLAEGLDLAVRQAEARRDAAELLYLAGRADGLGLVELATRAIDAAARIAGEN